MNNEQFKIFLYLIMSVDFRDRVMKPNKDRSYFWSKWRSEEPQSISEEKKALEFIDRMSFKKEELSPDEMDEILGKVLASEKASIWTLEPETWYSSIRTSVYMKVAMLIVIIASSIFFSRNLFRETNTIKKSGAEWVVMENKAGERSEFILADGTIVNLNAKSKLSYPVTFEKGYRKVKLFGEAFFDVKKDRSSPFYVETNDIEIQVLGTIFNVKSFAGESTTKVSLVEGKVRVNKRTNLLHYESVLLSPGEQLTYHKKSEELVKEGFDLNEVLFWKERVVIFKNAGLEDFVQKMEELFDVNFQIYGTLSKKMQITGKYKCESLEDALMGLKFVYDIDYKIDGKSVILNLTNKNK